MIYTILVLLEKVAVSELENNAFIQTVPRLVSQISDGHITCKNTSQFFPAPYIHFFDVEHIPPYKTILPVKGAYHIIGYIYIETDTPMPNPLMLFSGLNDFPEVDGKAIFLDAEESTCPVTVMEEFIKKMQKSPSLSETTAYIVDLYEAALEAKDEVAAMTGLKEKMLN